MKRLLAVAVLASALQMIGAGFASAQDMYVGEVRLFGFSFCPLYWLQASGQILSIQQYTPLFALYGTTYGGDGQRTFALPNLNGRAPYGSGSPGQPLGAVYGNSTVTLTVANLPAHTHPLLASTNPPTTNTGQGGLSASFNAGDKVYAASGSPANVPYSPTAVGMAGGNLPVSIQSPALAMLWCVAWNGIFPSRP